jgi:glycosyltransferase involved in cell wall biosynthesis
MVNVSVVIPTYNCAQHLPNTIRSVLAQTYSDYEIIVVDDGSTDDTQEALRPFSRDITYIYQNNSGGPARPRNVGIERARGMYVSFLDADDILFPEKLRHAVDFLEALPALGLVFSNFIKRSEDGRQYPEPFLAQCGRFRGVEKSNFGPNRFVIRNDLAFDTLLLENFVGTSSVVCPKSVLSKVGGFDESVTYGGLEDREMWLKITRSHDIGYLDTVEHVYVDRQTSVSKRALAATLCRLQVLERHARHAHSDAARRDVRRAIARQYGDAGYNYTLSGDMPSARRAYLKSLLKGNVWTSGKGLLRTTMLGRGLAAAKRLASHKRGSERKACCESLNG